MKKTPTTNQHGKEVLILHKVDPIAYKDCISNLTGKFRAIDLSDMIKTVSKWLSNKMVMTKDINGKTESCLPINIYFLVKKKDKQASLNFLAYLLCNEYNCRLMIDQFHPFVKSTLLKCLDVFYIRAEELYEAEGNCIVNKGRYDEGLGSNSPWFEIIKQKNEESQFYSYKYFIHLPSPIYPYFYRACHAENEEAVLTDQPQEEGLHFMNTEEDLLQYYPIINHLYGQEELCAGSNKKISISVIRKCARQTRVQEFFPYSDNLAVKDLRSTFLFTTFYHKLKKNALKTKRKLYPLQEVLVEKPYPQLPPLHLLIHILLPHLSGANFMKMDYTNCLYMFYDILSELGKKAPNHQWVSVEGMIGNLLRKNACYSHIHLFHNMDFYYNYVKFKNKANDKGTVYFDQYRKEVSEPFVRGVLLLLASVGMLDIAYRDYQESDTSYVDWLKYVRLTNLGDYAVGISQEYQPKVVTKEIKYFEIDEEWLMIRTLEDNPPYLSFLEETGIPAGPHRYKFSIESFLSRCTDKNDVAKKIDFFKQTIGTPTSEVWTRFFEALPERCGPFKEVKKSNYAIYQIDPDNKDMIHLIGTDPVLKKWVIRAEGFLFLVKKEDLDAFTSEMKKRGYIL